MSKKGFKHYVSKTLTTFEKYFMPIMTKVAENRYLQAIRNGIIATIPMILIGSLFLVLYFFPIGEHTFEVIKEVDGVQMTTTVNVNSFGGWLLNASGKPEWASFVLLPYRMTFAMMGFFSIFGIAKSLAKHYKIDEQQAVFLAIIVYLISIVGPNYEGVGSATIISGSLGSASLFGGIIISIFTVEVFRILIKYKIIIRMPAQVPDVVAKPFNAVIPLFFVTIPSILLFFILKFDIHSFMAFLLEPLQDFFASNNLIGMIVFIVFVMFLWISGIHGINIMATITRPFWLIAIAGNEQLLSKLNIKSLYFSNGGSIFTEPFYQWFVWIGGAGATIGLLISMLIFAKSKYGKSITRASVVTSIFNINEPIIFGFPVVLNPLLAIPAMLAPLVMGILGYLAMQLNIVAVPSITVAWTLPSPIGAFLSTLDWKAVVLNIILIAVSTIIWLPFAKAYDRDLVKKEKLELETNNLKSENRS